MKIQNNYFGFSKETMQYAFKYMPAVIAIVLITILGQILSPGFASMNNMGNILTVASLLAIISIGQCIVFIAGNSGIDLSVGALVSLGAVMGPMISGGLEHRLPYAILMVLLTGAVFGGLSGIGVQIIKVPPLVMTLVMAAVVRGFTMAYTGGAPGWLIPPSLARVASPFLGEVRPVMIWMLVIIIAFEFVLRRLRYGKSLYMIGSNRSAGRLCGLPVSFLAISAYVVAGMMSCFGGIFFAGFSGVGELGMGEFYTMQTVAVVVIGGISVKGGSGSLIGVVLGSIVLTLLTSILVALGLQAGVREFFQGMILLAILIITCREKKLRQ